MHDEDEDRAVRAPGEGVRQTGAELPMHPDVARAYIEQRAHAFLGRVLSVLRAKRELANREQKGLADSGECTATPDTKGASHE